MGISMVMYWWDEGGLVMESFVDEQENVNQDLLRNRKQLLKDRSDDHGNEREWAEEQQGSECIQVYLFVYG